MFLRYVRSKDGSTVTLSDGVTQVGAFPVLLDIDTTMAQTALQQNQIIQVDSTTAELVIDLARNISGGGGGAITAATLSSATTMQSGASTTGVGTPLNTSGYGVALIAISGAFVGTITFQGQGPDNNWYAINAKQRGGGSISTTTTSTGLFELNCRALTAVRANITALTSGSVTVVGVAQPLPAADEYVSVQNSNAQSGVSVTTSDTNDLATKPTKGVYIGTTGDLKVAMSDGSIVTFPSMASGIIHPLAVNRIYATGTTAGAIVAVY